jgi:hypothetical protein
VVDRAGTDETQDEDQSVFQRCVHGREPSRKNLSSENVESEESQQANKKAHRDLRPGLEHVSVHRFSLAAKQVSRIPSKNANPKVRTYS